MEKSVKPSIAFFDFDGTITSKDTLAEVIKFSKGKIGYYVGLIILSPVLVSYKIGLLSNQKAKEMMLKFFFKGKALNEFDGICNDFTKTKLPSLLRKNALAEIRKLIQNNTKVVVVSASPANWVSPWCKNFNIDCIATILEVKNKKITGKISGNNCSGMEKVNRIKEKYNLDDYAVTHAYGDTKGDIPMLSLSANKFYKPFTETLID